MTAADLPGADALRELAGWNQTLEAWRMMLRLQPGGCFVAEHQAVVVGTVTTIGYGGLAWIGMMLVHPEYRRQGIATRLMRQALEFLGLEHIPCVKLDATPAGFPVYEKLGFVAEWTLRRWQRTEPKPRIATREGEAGTRPLQAADWPTVEALDARGFGVARGQLLRSLAARSRLALVWPAQGTPKGWGLLRPGARADYLGPLTCVNADGAGPLVLAVLQAAENRPVFWDIPDQNAAAVQLAEDLGFTPVRPLTRMRLGPDSIRADPVIQFGIADPAVG